jgi:hypothetical protein
MEEEVFKKIIEFPNYEISNLGNCRNIKTMRILKPILQKSNYYKYTLGQNEEDKKIKKHLYQHRLIGLYHIDNPLNKTYIDHIDQNRSNNNITNLRWVTRSENNRNKKKSVNKTSIYNGVYFDKTTTKWMAKIEVNYKKKYIGRFATEVEAAEARDKYILANQLDEFFKLNFLIEN